MKRGFWILQDKNFGLGNFVNLTPLIYDFSEKGKFKVPVYFESDYVREIYKHWEIIEVLNEPPPHNPIISSSAINRENTCPDYEYAFNIFNPEKPTRTHAPDFKVAVIANGCANPEKRHTKQPDNKTYEYIITKLRENGYFTVFIGNNDDYNNSPFANKCNVVAINNPELASVWIAKSDLVVMNDTGFYHLAGAYQKRGFILWMNTLLPKNLSPNVNFFISRNHIKDFDEWL